MRTIRTDVAVIGAGTAGLSAYRSAKAEGRTAVIIEGGEYGTTCARVGCMPSKLLIAAAEAAHAASHADAFGVRVEGGRVDGQAAMDRVRSERDRFVGFVVDGVHALPEADRLIGHVRFIDDRLLQAGAWFFRDAQTSDASRGDYGYSRADGNTRAHRKSTKARTFGEGCLLAGQSTWKTPVRST